MPVPGAGTPFCFYWPLPALVGASSSWYPFTSASTSLQHSKMYHRRWPPAFLLVQRGSVCTSPLQAAECLSCSTAIYRISKFLIPRLPLLKSWEIFPRPTPRRLCCLGLPQQAQKKKQGMLSILRILLRAHNQTEVQTAGEDGPGCQVGIFYDRISF